MMLMGRPPQISDFLVIPLQYQGFYRVAAMGFEPPHYSTYGDNPGTPVHYGREAVTTWRFAVWIALSLPSINLHSRASVCRINTASCITWPDSPPVSMPTRPSAR